MCNSGSDIDLERNGILVTAQRQNPVFGKRSEPHTVIIARGDDIRHFTIRPWMAALVGSVLSAIAIGYLLATSYLVLRDDLIGAASARQARMQQSYEDRISALRSQVDRITSRQLLDQQLMEKKVTELIERQTQLSQRHGRIGPMIDRASGALPATAPVPEEKPEIRAGLGLGLDSNASKLALFASNAFAPQKHSNFWNMREGLADAPTAADKADRLFVAINQSLRSIETEQIRRIDTMAQNAYQTADMIADTLEDAGLKIDADYGKESIGGPLVAAEKPVLFEERVRDLDIALEKLEAVKKVAARLPLENPAPGTSISSSFGNRRDPILGRPAFHSGIDFRAISGTPVTATAPGVVTKAGWNGGYGRMVEIDHGNGFSTRYAHMSKIGVKVGQKVQRGSKVGRVGSSGRSTGPHLHYEVRRNGDAVNPLRFLKIGKKINTLL